MTWDAQTDFSRPRLSPGTRLNGIYEIDHPIGVGGMGEIYKGHLIETGDAVAIKMMLPEFTQNEAAFNLFRKEASALHHIHHDAIVRYYVFTIEPVLRRPYLAMEFVDGRALSDILRDNGPLPFEAVRLLLNRAALGLAAAHQHGIIHRDISPDNILVPNGDVTRAKIIDFGIARTTQHGTVIGDGFAGKYNYVSPEQLGLFGANVTARSDIYSLGLVLAQALTGQAIDMGGSQLDVIEKRRRLPALGAIDMRFRPLLEKMLQPDPDKRPESMAVLATWSPAPSTTRAGLFDRRKPAGTDTAPRRRSALARHWKAVTAVLVLVGLVSGGGAFYFYGMQAPAVSVPPSATLRPARPESGTGTQSALTPPSQGSTADKITSYVKQYNGGDCFFVTPVAISDRTAVIEGFGSSTKPFATLNTEFQRTIGFEPDIGLRQITEQECPAVTFLARLGGSNERAPRLDIDRDSLRNGDTLKGTIDRYGARDVQLILVSDSGAVENLSSLLKPGVDAKLFDIGMRRVDGSHGRQPQLLIAVASASPLEALRPGRTADARDYFTRALDESTRTGNPLSATAKYFMLEK